MDESLKAVKDAYRALGRGDLLTFLSALHEQVEWHFPLGERPVVHHGQVAIVQNVLDARTGRGHPYVPDRVLSGPDHVVAFGADFAHVWLFDGAQAARIHAFEDNPVPKNWGPSLGPAPGAPGMIASHLTHEEGASWLPGR